MVNIDDYTQKYVSKYMWVARYTELKTNLSCAYVCVMTQLKTYVHNNPSSKITFFTEPPGPVCKFPSLTLFI